MEDYGAKMQLKSDAALREYVTGYAQYRDEAVLAALAELRRRDHPAPEETELRPLLEAAVSRQQAEDGRDQKVAEEEEAAEAPLPRLYSLGSIAIISAVGSVVIGAVMLAMNMYRQGRRRAIVSLAVVVIGYLVAESLAIKWLIAQQAVSPFSLIALDLPLIFLFAWWFWPQYVRTYQLQARSWLLPLVIALFIRFGLPSLLLLNPTFRQAIQQQMQQIQQNAPR